MSYTVLLVEDNPHIMEINYEALMMEDYEVLKAYDGRECMEQLAKHRVDLIVLDIMLPDSDGYTLCRRIKEEYDIPILFLSALGENEQIIRALREGGDDYMTKPYDLGVLLAHVEARLRSANNRTRIVTFDRFSLDTVSMVATYDGKDLLLTKKEFSVLRLLAAGSPRPVSMEELYASVWKGPVDIGKNAFYTTVSRLNRKLDNAGSSFSVTNNGTDGYTLEKT